MASVEMSTVIILSEIIILETVFIVGGIIYIYLKRKKINTKLRTLFKSFQDDEKNRTNVLSKLFTRPNHLKEEDYSNNLQKIITSEMIFYKYLISSIYSNNTKIFDSFNEELQNLTQAYTDLIPSPENSNSDSIDPELEPDINVDDAIDELLADDETVHETNNDPALDLSEDTETTDDSSTSQDEIAEIPSELLNTETETETETIAKNPESVKTDDK